MDTQKPLTPATMKVWNEILQLRASGIASPSYAQIAAVCGIPENVVGNHLAALRAAGYVQQHAYWHRGVRLAKRAAQEQ